MVLVSGRSFVFVLRRSFFFVSSRTARRQRDASPRTTMMMESRDTQILSDLPPRCDVDDDDDDDDDASIVFVVVLSEEEEDRRRRERPRDPLRSSNDASKRDTTDRLSKTISSRRHIEEGLFLFFKGEAPTDDKTKFVSLVRKKKRERETERSAPSPTRRRLSPPPTTTFFSFCCCCCCCS